MAGWLIGNQDSLVLDAMVSSVELGRVDTSGDSNWTLLRFYAELFCDAIPSAGEVRDSEWQRETFFCGTRGACPKSI